MIISQKKSYAMDQSLWYQVGIYSFSKYEKKYGWYNFDKELHFESIIENEAFSSSQMSRACLKFRLWTHNKKSKNDYYVKCRTVCPIYMSFRKQHYCICKDDGFFVHHIFNTCRDSLICIDNIKRNNLLYNSL